MLLQAEFAVRGEAHGGNKLRTYKTFKNTYITEPYVHIITQKKFRSAYANFRCGVAPIRRVSRGGGPKGPGPP